MLKLTWEPTFAGAPDAPGYATALDYLCTPDSTTRVQSFPKPSFGLMPADPPLASAVDAWVGARADPGAPVFVMVHGYQYDPTDHLGGGQDDPFGLVYGYPGESYGKSQQKLAARQSWLPLVGECDDSGQHREETAIAFAWVSEGSLLQYGGACWDNDYKYAALDLAPAAAKALATVLAHLAKTPARVHVLAHSLGTRVASEAIGIIRSAGLPSTIDRVVFLDGAEYCVDAAANFQGCGFDVFNLANRQDLVLSGGGETACHPVRQNGSIAACVIGFEGLGANGRWLDLQLDSAAFRDWCKRGFAPTGTTYTIDPKAEDPPNPVALLNHWACYENSGNRVLVRDLLQAPSMTRAALTTNHVPSGVDSPCYGQFNGQAIPPTPQACRNRQTLVA